LIQENSGQVVNLSRKLEIKVTVDHVGHSELLKPCLIESVLPQVKRIKPESQLKLYYHAADLHVVVDAMEVILQEPGAISLDLVLFPEIYMVMINGADLILWLHVIIIPQENMNHVQEILQPQLAKNNVQPPQEKHMQVTKLKEKNHIQFLESPKSKLKFQLSDQLNVLSQFMKIS